MSHKHNCTAHPSVAHDSKSPEMFSDDWIELEVDKQLSKWIAEWRSCFVTWATIALDLANHPPDRVMTHWYVLASSSSPFLAIFPSPSVYISSLNPATLNPSLLETTASVTPILPRPPSHTYPQVIQAEVLPLSQIKQTHPNLITQIDPDDFTRLRFVITLQNEQGILHRVRLIQWTDLSLDWWTKLPKNGSAELADGVPEALVYAIENMTVDDVQDMLGHKKKNVRWVVSLTILLYSIPWDQGIGQHRVE